MISPLNKLTAIIPYCSYDKDYIIECIDSALGVCSNVKVSYTDTLFGGDPEDMNNIESLIAHYKSNSERVSFTFYKVKHECSITEKHNISRSVIIEEAKLTGTTHILLLDADEIIDVARFNKWIDTEYNKNIYCYRFKNYWYFRSPLYRANTLENTTVLADIKLHQGVALNSPERDFYCRYGYSIVDRVDGEPLVHHYSWAKSQQDLLVKVKNWGHKLDRDWTSLINEEYSKPFSGKDFVHGYSYTILDKKFTNK